MVLTYYYTLLIGGLSSFLFSIGYFLIVSSNSDEIRV